MNKPHQRTEQTYFTLSPPFRYAAVAVAFGNQKVTVFWQRVLCHFLVDLGSFNVKRFSIALTSCQSADEIQAALDRHICIATTKGKKRLKGSKVKRFKY